MEVKVTNVSNNSETGQKYDRTIYVCRECDTWVSVEIPKEKN